MKKFVDFSILDEKVVSVVQRKKQARRMAKLARSASFQAKKKRTMMRVRSSAILLLVAKKQTLMKFRKKLYPNYNEMSMQQKVRADQVVLQRFGPKIDKISQKLAKKLKTKEVERIANLKAPKEENQ